MKTTMAGQIDVAALLGAVMEENTAQIEALLTPLNIPKGDPLAGVAMIEGRTDIESRFLGIQCLAGFVRARGDIRFAAELALHLVKALKSHNFFEPEQPVHRQFMAANVLDLCASCLPDAGRGAELLAQAPEWVAWLDQAHFNAQWRSVQCAHAEAAMHAGAYELAARLLGLLRQRSGESQTSPIERRLNDKLEDLLRAVDQPDTPSASLATIIEQSLKQLGWDGLAGNSAFQELPPSELVTKAEQFGALIGLGPAPQGLEQITEAIGLLPNAAHPFHEVSNVLTSLANVLASVKPGNVSQYVYVANLAEQACKCARAYGFWEQDISLGWLQGVALRRAGRQRSAAAVLAQLRQSIRERQRGIREVKLRAALAVHLPHLSAVSAEVLFQLGAGSEEELFQVIENSKARILGDLITERFRDSEAPESLKPLRQLLGQSRQRVSYISLLLDEEVTYAILLSPEGVLHPAQLKFGRTAVAAAAQELGFLNDGEPGSLVREAGIDPDRPWDTDYGPVFVAIRGLGAWLASLFDRGILRDGDVVCFAPDGPLYNLPLAAIPVGDKPLIERVALTFVPSAEMLLHCARFRSAQPLQRGFSMVVPRSTEFDSRLYDLEFYNKDADELRKHWQTMAVAPENLTASACCKAILTAQSSTWPDTAILTLKRL